MAIVTLRYWAAAREAAGVPEEKVPAGTLAEALAASLAARAQETEPARRLRQLLAISSFLVDGEPAGRRAPETIVLADGAVVEILPPFAGG